MVPVPGSGCGTWKTQRDEGFSSQVICAPMRCTVNPTLFSSINFNLHLTDRLTVFKQYHLRQGLSSAAVSSLSYGGGPKCTFTLLNYHESCPWPLSLTLLPLVISCSKPSLAAVLLVYSLACLPIPLAAFPSGQCPGEQLSRQGQQLSCGQIIPTEYPELPGGYMAGGTPMSLGAPAQSWPEGQTCMLV
jgi:hypothetical protein